MTHRALVRAILSLALLAVILPAGSARAAALTNTQSAACAKSGAMVTTLYTFKIEAKPQKKSYTAGKTAKVEMRVTRPGPYDPLGGTTEIPRPTEQPAAGVDVAVSMYAGIYYMYGTGVTDENGEATVSVKLHRNSPAGWVRADTSARAYYNRGGCPDIEEAGFQPFDRFLKITR